jgi:hypothetical protein
VNSPWLQSNPRIEGISRLWRSAPHGVSLLRLAYGSAGKRLPLFESRAMNLHAPSIEQGATFVRLIL